jgi:hypothetical protein
MPHVVTLVTCLVATTLDAGPAIAADKPDVHLEVDASKYVMPVGDTVDLTYTLSNMGAVAVGNARMEGSITGAPSLTIAQQPSGQPSLCTLSGSVLSCPALNLGRGDSTTEVRASASSIAAGTIYASGTLDPYYKVDESNEANNSSAWKIVVYHRADLTTSILHGPDVVHVGDHVQFTVLVHNFGGAASSIGLDFRTTSGLVYESVDFVDGITQGSPATCTTRSSARTT